MTRKSINNKLVLLTILLSIFTTKGISANIPVNSIIGEWTEYEEAGEQIYESKITKSFPEGKGARKDALNYEDNRAKELRDNDELEFDKHKRP